MDYGTEILVVGWIPTGFEWEDSRVKVVGKRAHAERFQYKDLIPFLDHWTNRLYGMVEEAQERSGADGMWRHASVTYADSVHSRHGVTKRSFYAGNVQVAHFTITEV